MGAEVLEIRNCIRDRLGSAKSEQWILAHLDHSDKDRCLIWPFKWIDGAYPRFGTPSETVHRLMCKYRNGPPPSDHIRLAEDIARERVTAQTSEGER